MGSASRPTSYGSATVLSVVIGKFCIGSSHQSHLHTKFRQAYKFLYPERNISTCTHECRLKRAVNRHCKIYHLQFSFQASLSMQQILCRVLNHSYHIFKTQRYFFQYLSKRRRYALVQPNHIGIAQTTTSVHPAIKSRPSASPASPALTPLVARLPHCQELAHVVAPQAYRFPPTGPAARSKCLAPSKRHLR